METKTKNGKKLAVIFPGIGYTPDKPLLYYGKKILNEAGYSDVKIITYNKATNTNIRGDRKKMEETFYSLYAQAEESLSDVDWSLYEDVVFVSKSIGTVIATAYAEKLTDKMKRIRQVLYTPLEHTFSFDPGNAIAFTGTADPWCVTDDVVTLAGEHRVPIFIYDGANHSLETGNVMQDMMTLRDVMHKTKEYLEQ